MARVRAGRRIVLLTQDMRGAVQQSREAHAETESLRREVAKLRASACPHCGRAPRTDEGESRAA
jgi:hypothetical protein